MDWASVFLPSAPIMELLVRGTVTFLVLILLLRLVGQREAGGLGMTDLLVVVLVADAASAGLTGDSESIGDGLILVGTILIWSVLLDAVTYRWPTVGRVIKAGAEPLIRDGELNRRVMRRELMNRDEVLSQLRLHGLTHESEVHRAYVEPNGMVSVIPRQDGQDAEDEETEGPPAPPIR